MRIRPRRRFTPFCLLALLGFGALVSGCTAPRQEQPSVNAAELSDEGFQAYVAELNLVTVDEAYRAMLILADGQDGSKDFEERKTKLESRGIARSAWKLEPENVIDSGSVAYMVCKICQIRGGVNMNLFGSWGLGDRRYALRELVYREMIDESVDYQFMTGAILYGLMRDADELMAKKGLYESQGVDLSDEGDRDAQGNLIVPPSTQPSP
ncbi:MAG TPA: hypothetical protein VJZ71_21380 [Phycisphaerae bacterium]|nr:hypothetical protein [Phycisphaerae bacterium]